MKSPLKTLPGSQETGGLTVWMHSCTTLTGGEIACGSGHLGGMDKRKRPFGLDCG
jgi:hypothetical protein